jgi:hypothetical protein
VVAAADGDATTVAMLTTFGSDKQDTDPEQPPPALANG